MYAGVIKDCSEQVNGPYKLRIAIFPSNSRRYIVFP